jgi:ParB-like chromosome segregation protein Spo0J
MITLVESVRQHGILEPILLRSLDNNTYELVAGERRYRAAKEVGLDEIPAVVRQMTPDEALQIALVENLQREDINPVEETEAILQLLVLKLNLSVDEVTAQLYRMRHIARGEAELSYADDTKIKLKAGDYLLIPAHTKHRVEYTSVEPACIWLAVHGQFSF